VALSNTGSLDASKKADFKERKFTGHCDLKSNCCGEIPDQTEGFDVVALECEQRPGVRG
jgi:hypothetical protein